MFFCNGNIFQEKDVKGRDLILSKKIVYNMDKLLLRSMLENFYDFNEFVFILVKDKDSFIKVYNVG